MLLESFIINWTDFNWVKNFLYYLTWKTFGFKKIMFISCCTEMKYNVNFGKIVITIETKG